MVNNPTLFDMLASHIARLGAGEATALKLAQDTLATIKRLYDINSDRLRGHDILLDEVGHWRMRNAKLHEELRVLYQRLPPPPLPAPTPLRSRIADLV